LIKSCDVGSLPFIGDFEKFREGAAVYRASQELDSSKYFERRVLKGFLDKIKLGVDVPNYPQFRDMNKMFLDLIKGVEKTKSGYIESELLSEKTKRCCVPEVSVINDSSEKIYTRLGRPFKSRICVTGPHTLSCLFTHRDNEIFSRLGNVISRIVENSIFIKKHWSTDLVVLEEPTFGILDDQLLDYGAEGREILLRAWESIFSKARSRGVSTCIHLHSTIDPLFWEVESLNVVESHVGDLLYHSDKTNRRLESTDKFLKASICVTDFDRLIREKLVASFKAGKEQVLDEKVAEAWKSMTSGETEPTTFLESVDLMKGRLNNIVKQFGAERVLYAGPECGLKTFPTYECALEYLRRAAYAVENFGN
jgi:5-methyltetrahydropteroyltriglutamate--homocysteine methyltransferase